MLFDTTNPHRREWIVGHRKSGIMVLLKWYLANTVAVQTDKWVGKLGDGGYADGIFPSLLMRHVYIGLPNFPAFADYLVFLGANLV